MAAEIVHDDDVARLELRDENLLNIGAEAFAVDWTVEQARCGETVASQGAEESQRPPVAMRREAPHPLAFWPPSAQWGHIGLNPGLVDKNQTFLYVVRPNVSALRYNIGVGPECTTLSGMYHVVRKEEPKQSGDTLGARVLYLDKDYRIHGSSAAVAPGKLAGCIRLVDEDVIYLYDRTPLESRVVVAN